MNHMRNLIPGIFFLTTGRRMGEGKVLIFFSRMINIFRKILKLFVCTHYSRLWTIPNVYHWRLLFPVTSLWSCLSVDWSVELWVLKGRKFHFHAPIGELSIYKWSLVATNKSEILSSITCGKWLGGWSICWSVGMSVFWFICLFLVFDWWFVTQFCFSLRLLHRNSEHSVFVSLSEELI